MASLNANGTSMVNWVDEIVQGNVPDYQAHDFICYQLQHSSNPVFKANAAFGCQVWTFPFILGYLWAHREGNPAGNPTCLNPTTDGSRSTWRSTSGARTSRTSRRSSPCSARSSATSDVTRQPVVRGPAARRICWGGIAVSYGSVYVVTSHGKLAEYGL